jgi:hypothetical protein
MFWKIFEQVRIIHINHYKILNLDQRLWAQSQNFS